MILSTTTIATLAQGFNAAFLKGFGTVTPSWQQVAMEIPSTTDAENYGWMEDVPGMREWVGQRVIHNLKLSGAKLYNKTFEHTLGVKVDDIEDDKLGIYAPRFSMQGEVAARHPDDLVWGLLPKGFNTKGFDGQNFFDADHASFGRNGKEKSWSNIIAGSGKPWFLMDLSRVYMKPLVFQLRKKVEQVKLDSSTDLHVFMNDEILFGCKARYNAGFGFHQLAVGCTDELTPETYKAARLALSTQFRADGSPLGVNPTHLVFGPSNEAQALELINAERTANGGTNIWRGTAQLVKSPWLE